MSSSFDQAPTGMRLAPYRCGALGNGAEYPIRGEYTQMTGTGGWRQDGRAYSNGQQGVCDVCLLPWESNAAEQGRPAFSNGSDLRLHPCSIYALKSSACCAESLAVCLQCICAIRSAIMHLQFDPARRGTRRASIVAFVVSMRRTIKV